MPLLEQRSVNELARRRHARRFCVITAKYIPWEPIGAMTDDRKDGRLMLLWDGDRPVIGRWDDGRKGWEDPEGMQLDRKSVVKGKSVSVRVDLGGTSINKKTRKKQEQRKLNKKQK